jgi:hypothetical protein
MSLVIIAFKNAPTPTPECKAKDEALDNEIRKKTIGRKIIIIDFYIDSNHKDTIRLKEDLIRRNEVLMFGIQK